MIPSSFSLACSHRDFLISFIFQRCFFHSNPIRLGSRKKKKIARYWRTSEAKTHRVTLGEKHFESLALSSFPVLSHGLSQVGNSLFQVFQMSLAQVVSLGMRAQLYAVRQFYPHVTFLKIKPLSVKCLVLKIFERLTFRKYTYLL